MNNNQLSAKQAGTLLCVGIISSKLLLLPSILHSQAKNQAIFILLFVFLLEFLCVWFLLKVKQKFYPMGLFEIFQNKIGTFLTKLVFFFFVVYFSLKFLYVFVETYYYLKEMVNEDSTIISYALSTLPVVNFLVLKGLRCLGRTAQFYFWFLVVGVVSCFSVGILAGATRTPDIQFGLEFFPKIFNVLFWFGDYGFLLLLFDKIKPEKNLNKIVLRYFLYGAVLVLCVHLMYLSLFGNTTFMHYFALSDIVQFNIFFGGLWKLDILALLTIMFLLYFSMSVFMYCFCESINKIFPTVKRVYSVAIIDIFIFVCMYLFLINLESLTNMAIGYLKYLSLFCMIFVPLVLMTLFFASKKKGEKYENIYK